MVFRNWRGGIVIRDASLGMRRMHISWVGGYAGARPSRDGTKSFNVHFRSRFPQIHKAWCLCGLKRLNTYRVACLSQHAEEALIVFVSNDADVVFIQ